MSLKPVCEKASAKCLCGSAGAKVVNGTKNKLFKPVHSSNSPYGTSKTYFIYKTSFMDHTI